MNSASPQLTPGPSPSSGPARTWVVPVARSWTCSVPARTNATRAPVGSGRGSITGPSTGSGSGLAPGHQVDGERPARHHEDRQAGRGVEGVLDDPAGLLADPLAAGALLRRQVLLAGDVEVARVDEQVLLPGRDVEQPQAGHGVVAGAAAQQHHAAPVGRDRGPAGRTEGEPARGGLAAREAGRGIGGGGVDGHAAESACCHPLDARTRSPPPVRLGPWWRRSGARSP